MRNTCRDVVQTLRVLESQGAYHGHDYADAVRVMRDRYPVIDREVQLLADGIYSDLEASAAYMTAGEVVLSLADRIACHCCNGSATDYKETQT